VRGGFEVAELLAAGLVPCLAYAVLGLPWLRPLGIQARGAERLALAFVFGSGSASLAILLLRALGIPLPVWGVGGAAGLVLLAGARLGRGGASALPAPGWARGVDLASAALAVLTFLVACAPETSWDGFEYHLPLVTAWTEGPIRAVPGLLDAEFRAGVDLLYAPMLTSGFPDAAAAVSAGFALALAALVRGEAGRRASPGAGALAGCFTLLVPFSVEAAPTSYVDLGVAAYGFSALRFADRWNRGGAAANLAASALCLGFAANAKLHAAALCPAVLALVLLGGRRPSGRALLRSAGLVALVTAPWFVKVGITAGNPLFPLLPGWLGSGPTDARNLELRRLRLLANYPVERDLSGLARYLASITFGRSVHVSGLLGPLPLALAPFAWWRPSRASLALLAVGSALLVLNFLATPALRFGGPLWPWLAVAAAVGGRRVARSGRAARAVVGAALGLLALHHGVVTAQRYLPRIAALRHPTAYERAMFPDQDNLRRMVARADPVVGIPMGAVSWMPQPVYNLLWERNGELYFVEGTPPGPALALLRRRGVRSLVIDAEPPHPADGRVGHALVDAWLARGRAEIAEDVHPLPARGQRVWVLVRLVSTETRR